VVFYSQVWIVVVQGVTSIFTVEDGNIAKGRKSLVCGSSLAVKITERVSYTVGACSVWWWSLAKCAGWTYSTGDQMSRQFSAQGVTRSLSAACLIREAGGSMKRPFVSNLKNFTLPGPGLAAPVSSLRSLERSYLATFITSPSRYSFVDL